MTLKTAEFKPGQIIKVYSKWSFVSPVPIWHYGVVVGNDDVVHFNLVSEDQEIRIIRTNIKHFVNGGIRLQVCQMSSFNTTNSPDEIIQRALSLVGTDFGGYNLLTNNCEHFANWCATGVAYSNQVPSNEGEGHSIKEKAAERYILEPLFNTLDKAEKSLDKLNEKMDDFFWRLETVRLPWE